MINKLQFLHKSELFETREKAIEFLNNLRITRPSLFAEPVVLRYGNEKEPNVILAIGATGSGSTQATLDSSYFMIDAQGIKDDVQEKYDKIEHALAKLAFAIVDTNTLDLEKVETEDSITLKGNVKVPEKVAIKDSNITNIIKTNKDGLYSYVNLKFDDKTNTFTFQVNENVNTFSIPVIESGKYDISKEAIVFTFTDGKTTEVDVDDLIDEWTTEGENSETPIVLTKERHTDKNTDVDDRNSDQWKDVLKADVRIASDKEHNILEKTTDGRNLYVKGTADNIFFKDGKNVKEAIEAINTEVSSAYKGNIIFKDYANNGDYNGIAANVDVEYKKETNTLVFKRSDNDGQIVSKEFKLNSAAFIDDISYDTVNEKITIRYKDEDGKEQKTDIELSNLLDDWVTNSDGHNVELNKQVKAGEKDILTADVKLTNKTNDNYQILEERDDKLYVRGTADNIVYDTENGETVKSAFERTENELQTESDRAISAEKSLSDSVGTINSTIGSGFTTLKTETITEKFTSLSGKVDNEISERKESDKNFTKSIETLTESAETANTNITNLYNGLGDDYIGNNDSHTAENTVTNRLHRLEVSATTADANIKELSSKTVDLTSSAETANTKISELTNSASTLFEKADVLDDKIDAVSGSAHFEVGDTDTVAMSKNADVTSHTVTANVKVSSKDKNTILVDGNNGLYASLDYDADRNVIIISDTNSDTHKKEIQLNSVSVIEYMRYDKAREVIVIGYKSNASLSETNTLEIPITDVLSEWKTNNNSHSVRLVRTQHAVDGTDDLSGDVVLATEGNYTDNLIKQVTTTAYDEEMKGLYVSGEEVSGSARAIAKEEAKDAADKALVDAKAYTDSVHETVQSEITTAKENGVNEASAYTDNRLKTYDHNLHDELSILSGTTLQSAKDYSDSKDTELKTELKTYADDHISAASLNGGATNTAKVTIKDKLVTSDVIVSAMEGNIIKKSEEVAKGGIYANPASLTYQSATNSLTFTDENGLEKIIQLNSASFINSIKKSENGKSIIISYSDTSGGTHTIDISLQDLIDALAVDNIDKTINISIVKEDRNGISTNVLSAEANIANNTDEVLNLLTTTKKDGKGELLVNGKPIYDAIDKVKGNTDSLVNQGKDLQEELDAAEIGVFGVNTDKSFKYAPIPNSNYINDATSLISADDLLDKAIKKVSGDVTNVKTDNEGISADVKSLQAEIDRIEVGSGLDEQGNYIPSDKSYISGAISLADADKKLADAVASVDKSISNLTQGSKTYSVNVFTEKDDNTNASLLKADVRLSVANGQDESELTRTEMPNGNNYEGNLLQIVKAKSNNLAIELGEKINGLYFGGSIDYGMMEGDDNIKG